MSISCLYIRDHNLYFGMPVAIHLLGLWVSLAFVHEPEWNVDGFIVQAVERAAGPEGQRITYNIIKQRLNDVIYKLV